jgi:hypothetical protein
MSPRVDVPDHFGYRPFTLADAKAVGVSERVVRGSRFRRVFRGVYVRAEVVDSTRLRFDAVRRLSDRTWAMCHTAGELHGAPVPAHPAIHVGLPPGTDCLRSSEIAAHRPVVMPATVVVDGRRAATPEDTFRQLAAYLDLVDLVIVGDALVRLGRTSTRRLRDAAAGHVGRGSCLARRAAALVRARVDSPMETRLRLLIVLAGLPEPETGRQALDSAGGWIATPDLSYPAQRVALEYDGAHHAEARQRHGDNRRRDSYYAAGWRLLVVTSLDVYTYPAQTLVRIAAVLRDRSHPAVPTDLSNDWRAHFGPRSGRVGSF